MKLERLLVPASPASTAICPGCERECVMQVHASSGDGDGAVAFIVCDKRSDINRVLVSVSALARWKSGGELVADVLARLLGIDGRLRGADAGNRWHVGMLTGRKHKDRLALHAGGAGLTLAVAGHTVALEDVFTIKTHAIWLDKAYLHRCVDQPTGKVTLESESAEDRRKRLVSRISEVKSKGTVAFLKVVAAEEGISVSALKQVIYRKPKAASAMAQAAMTLMRPVPTNRKDKR